MQGAVPRTRAGTPDLSGVWENIGWRELQQVSNDISGTGGSPGTRPLVARATGVLTSGPGLFFDIAAGVQGGLPLQPSAAALKKRRMDGNSMDNPDAHCLPLGNMQLHTHPQPRKIIQTVDVVVLLYEGNAGVRQIFTDGRPLPANDPQPWWFGYSTGRWDGDTLVVETSGFRDGGWLDVNGSPLTDRGRNDGALPSHQLRLPRSRDHGRGSTGVHASVDRHDQAAADAGRRTDRVRVR
jgi:hypothetical protein